MNRNILAATVLIALCVLTFVQFRLLVIGARLEKQRFDQKLLTARQNIREALNEPNAVSDSLILFLKKKKENTYPAIADSLHLIIKNELGKVGATPQFSFAIAPRFNAEEIKFISNNFKKEDFDFNEYVVPLGNYFSSQLFGENTLHINVENLFGYLLTELDYLVIPSVLSLLALLLCLWLLINILQKEQKLNEVKNDFINNLTHELKTPTFSISLSNKMARGHLEKGNYEKVKEFLQIIENENNKLKNHTEKVLELASLENPNHQLKKEKTDVHILIKKMASDFYKNTATKNVELKINLNAKGFILNIDESHFKNAIYNLFDNALKYSVEKPIIEITTENKNQLFILKIKDNGPGISLNDQKYIFDKFYRVSNNNIHNVKGFGLGLNYVKYVVEAHGGKIGVESEIEEGAVFSIEIPF